MNFKATSNLTQFLRSIEKTRQQIPFATAKALTLTVKDVREGLKTEMQRVFKAPTPYTLRSLYMKSATKASLAAEVGHIDFGGKGGAAGKYLKPQVFGGSRPFKRSERQLGEYWVPTRRTPLNSYGNIRRGTMTQVLSVLGKNPDYYQNTTKRSRKRNKKLPEYFTSHGGRLPAGVWQRSGRKSIKPILFFTKSPGYTPRYDFFGISRKITAEQFPLHFRSTMAEAMRTAR